METIHIVNLNLIFAENAYCLSQRLGIDVIKDFVPHAGHTYIIFGAHEQSQVLAQIPNVKFIIINTEPPQSDHLRNKYYLQLMKSNVVLDYHPISTAYLKSLGIRVLCQYKFEFMQPDVPLQHKTDGGDPLPYILFVGSPSPRRIAIYNKLVERYPNKNIVFEMNWNHKHPQAMTALLQSAKYVLNIPFFDSKILETHRINKALACGCQVVSLYSGDKETDTDYEKYIHFTHDLFEFFDSVDIPQAPASQAKAAYQSLLPDLIENNKQINWILNQLAKTSLKRGFGQAFL